MENIVNKIHKGEWLKEEVKRSGRTQGDIAHSLNISLATLWRQFQEEDLSFAKMKLIADQIKLDLRKTFPDSQGIYQTLNFEYEEKFKLEEAKNKINSLEGEISKLRSLNEYLQQKLMECEKAS